MRQHIPRSLSSLNDGIYFVVMALNTGVLQQRATCDSATCEKPDQHPCPRNCGRMRASVTRAQCSMTSVANDHVFAAVLAREQNCRYRIDFITPMNGLRCAANGHGSSSSWSVTDARFRWIDYFWSFGCRQNWELAGVVNAEIDKRHQFWCIVSPLILRFSIPSAYIWWANGWRSNEWQSNQP